MRGPVLRREYVWTFESMARNIGQLPLGANNYASGLVTVDAKNHTRGATRSRREHEPRSG